MRSYLIVRTHTHTYKHTHIYINTHTHTFRAICRQFYFPCMQILPTKIQIIIACNNEFQWLELLRGCECVNMSQIAAKSRCKKTILSMDVEMFLVIQKKSNTFLGIVNKEVMWTKITNTIAFILVSHVTPFFYEDNYISHDNYSLGLCNDFDVEAR